MNRHSLSAVLAAITILACFALAENVSANTFNQTGAGGTQVVFPDPAQPGFDYESGIAENTWAPKVSRGENNDYYAVCRYAGINSGLKIYRNTGNPATTAWVNVLNLYNREDLIWSDIEVVSSEDRCFVVYQDKGADIVECFWFQLSNPANYGFSTVGPCEDDGAYLSLTSDEVEFNSGVNLYASWVHDWTTNALYYNRSTTLGTSWDAAFALSAANANSMYGGNAISYCPGNDHVYIAYTNLSDEVYVTECTVSRGAAATPTSWSYDNVFTSATTDYISGGITSNYLGYILATAYANYPATGYDVIWSYSTNSGSTWSAINSFGSVGDGTYPSCTSNNDGRFSMLFYYTYGTTQVMYSAYAIYTNLTSAGWSTQEVDTETPYAWYSSACIEDGTTPMRGGTWGSGFGSGYASYFGWNSNSNNGINLTLTPYTTPILVPYIGGTFPYRVNLQNTGTGTYAIEAWVDIYQPTGFTFGPILGPVTPTLTPGWTYNNLFTYTVPSAWPAGDYSLNGYVRIGGNLVELDNFVFTKLDPFDSRNGSGMVGWTVAGDELFGQTQVSASLPDKLALSGASPNPFNPTTTISFTLPEAGKVKLAVFDLQGRPVATLVDGYREAGEYQSTFDANTLTSGVYIARLTSGAFSQTQKLVLMK